MKYAIPSTARALIAALLAGNHTAEDRMAAFLIGLSRRYAARGFRADRFQLTMSRADIANYLRLAAETVSRILRRFQDISYQDIARITRVPVGTVKSRLHHGLEKLRRMNLNLSELRRDT